MIKEPKTFKELLDLQERLEKSMNHKRERTVDDIKLSMLAEIIEFNEESSESHKTWKSKTFDKKLYFEEAVDIFFFLMQLVMTLEIDKKILWAVDCDYLCLNKEIANKEYTENEYLLYILIEKLSRFCECDYYYILSLTNIIFNLYKRIGITKEDLFEIYFEKWKYNMKRIGKEWD